MPSMFDAECGAPGLADGLCRVSAGGNRCTYPCASTDDCRSPFICVSGPSPRYCAL